MAEPTTTLKLRGVYRARAFFWLAWALYRLGLPREKAHALIRKGLASVRISIAGSPWMHPHYTTADLDRQLAK